MPESSTNVERKGKKDNLKRRSSAAQNEHIEGNVEVADGAVGAKIELQELTASLKQGFAQMSQDLSKTIAESFKLFQSEFEIQYEDMEGVEQEEIPQSKDDHVVNGEPAAKRKKDNKTTCLEEAVTKLTDSAGAQKTPSNKGKFMDHISFPQGNDLSQQSTDALALFANTNSELNQRRREFIKPDLHDEYKHLCSSSLAITDQLFGDDNPNQVKELTEVNRVGNKVSTHSGRSMAKPDFDRYNYIMLVAVDAQDISITGSLFRLVEKRPQSSSDLQAEDRGEVKVTQISSNVDVEVRNTSEQSVEIIGGRLI